MRFILHVAQRMGLVEAPTQPLTEDEWKKAKEKSNKRDDSKQPCVICKEDFGVQEQVQSHFEEMISACIFSIM